MVTVTTDLTGFPLPSNDTEANLAALNMSAALSALMLVRRGETPVLVSRLSGFDGDDEAWTLYTPLLAFAAGWQSEVFGKTILRGVAPQGRAEIDLLPDANLASHWGTRDFSMAQDLLDRAGILANSDATGLTAEFPWDPGATSQIARFFGGDPGGPTSLLRLATTERHPALGNGLLCRLTIRLNLLELVAIDAPPFFGAWTVDPETLGLTFVTFLPNVLYRPGVAANLTTWMMARSERAKRWTEVDTTLCALAREGRPSSRGNRGE